MNEVIGIIGAAGDLGSQLTNRLREKARTVLLCDPRLSESVSIERLLHESTIVHICAPLDSIKAIDATKSNALIVLHDSVMNTSRRFSTEHLGNDAAIVHMLLNSKSTVIVASDAPAAEKVAAHFTELEYSVQEMAVDEHDSIMARSQAPLALLIEALSPELYEHEATGRLTNSGEYLASVLRARQAAWTPATIRAILQNPQLPLVLDTMKSSLEKVRYNKGND